ncbi:MAG: sigma-70 family RNA polymerase sigma factor [Anaerolineae bacterium]|nr:sigma-70 family RNA polymerase sigma factor [Anaerolineae bacterium]
MIEQEARLVKQALEGDRSAFGDLVRLHQRSVRSLAYRLCGDAALADDAAQETFLRAWRALARYEHRDSMRNWLLRIVTNVVTDSLRQPQPADLDPSDLPSPEESPWEATERHELRARVRQAVLNLPPAARAALILREFEGFSYAEIAEVLDVPVGTVMSRLHYARQALRRTLAPEMEAR